MNKYSKFGVLISIFILLVGPIGLQVASGQRDTKREEIKVNLEPGEEYQNVRTHDIGGNNTDIRTNTDRWVMDYGGEEYVPQGVYRGPLLEPSLMELDYDPRFRWKKNESGTTTGKISSTTLIQKAEFSSSQIMNGASEIYIQAPFTSRCLDVLHMKQSQIPEGGKLYSSLHIYKGEVDSIDVQLKDTAITQQSIATVDGSSNIRPEAVVPITPADYKNGRPYVKVNTFIESDQTYSFVFNIITGGEKPELFVTDSDNFQTVDIQYNNEVNLFTSAITDVSNEMIKESTWYYTSPFVEDSSDYQYNKDYQETDIHLGTSFMFTEGVGEHYMFGKEIEVQAGDTMLFYPDIDWSEYSSGEVNKTSFYLPFMSDDRLGTSGPDSSDIKIGYTNIEEPSLETWNDITWNWQDFILFTNQPDDDVKGQEGADIIAIRFLDDTTLTIPMTARDLDYNYYNDNEIDYVTKRMGRWSNSKMLIANETVNDGETWEYQDKRWFYYNPYIKAELTEKIWAQVDSEGEGKESYSHTFANTAYYSNIDVSVVDKGNTSNTWSNVINLVKKGFKYTPVGLGIQYLQGEDPLSNVKGVLKNGVTSLVESTERFAGWLYDGLVKIWEGIQDLFRIIYNSVMEFVDWIVGIFEDIVQVLGTLAERLAYIAGLLGFVVVMAGVSKVSKLSEWSG